VDQSDLLRLVIDVLEEQQIVYCIGGSLASGVYGEPRYTHDIDVVVDLRLDQVARLCQAFPAPEFYVSQQAAREAVTMRSQFNVIHPTSGQKIDFMIARDDAWGRSQLGRRRREEIVVGRPGYAAAPEDVILAKLWYYHDGGSDKHLRDIAAMLQVSGDLIDRGYIDRWARELGYTEEWRAVLEKLGRRVS
jgi:hypothetical protein